MPEYLIPSAYEGWWDEIKFHYAPTDEPVTACGLRNGQFCITSNLQDVKCLNCKHTLEYRRALAVAIPN